MRWALTRRRATSGFLAVCPFVQGLPLGCALGLPMFAARMEVVSAGFFFERIDEQRAGSDIAEIDHVARGLEVLAGLLIVPILRAGREALEPVGRAGGMTGVAARMTLAFGEQNGLDASLEEFEIERGRVGGLGWKSCGCC